MTNQRNKHSDEDFEFGVDSKYSSREEQKSEATALMEERLMRMKNLSRSQIIRARLMQLKLRMEDYLEKPADKKQNNFREFLKNYIDTIYSKRNIFAKDINITPVRLSQVINSHREPGDEFMMRLIIHSEQVFENVCEFQNKTWYQIYYQGKIRDTMKNQEDWRPEVEMHVRLSESI